jgi:uncharacterized repeat protein (TIGR03803 family)
MWNKARSCDAILRTFAQSMRLALGLAFLLALPLQGQKFAVLYEFQSGTDGESPYAGLVRDVEGNFYGTTPFGGKLVQDCSYAGPGCGTVFKIDASGNESILYRFAGAPDGVEPMAGLIIDNDGNLYGVTFYGARRTMERCSRLRPQGKKLYFTVSVLIRMAARPPAVW